MAEEVSSSDAAAGCLLVIIIGAIIGGALYYFFSGDPNNLQKKTNLLPPDEISFLKTAKYWSDEYVANKDNELAESNDILDRRNALCPILNGGAFQNWVATFIDMDDDFNSLTMRVGFGNGVSFTSSVDVMNTSELSTFKPGERILISGSFDPSTDTCFSTTAITDADAMINPDFSTTIVSAKPLN